MASINPQNLDVTPSLAADDRVMTTNKDGITKTIMGATLLEFFAEGTTADAPGGAQNKVITLTDFEGSVLPAQFKINITFTEGNTFGDTTASTPTYPRIILKNKSGAALGTFDVCDSRGHAAGTGCWNNNDFISFKRYGSKLIITNSDVRQAVTSSTNGYTIYSDGTIGYSKEQTENYALGVRVAGSFSNVFFNIGEDTKVTLSNKMLILLRVWDITNGNNCIVSGFYQRNVLNSPAVVSTNGINLTGNNQYGTFNFSGLNSTPSNNKYEFFYKLI